MKRLKLGKNVRIKEGTKNKAEAIFYNGEFESGGDRNVL